jgi:hypothetical protein
VVLGEPIPEYWGCSRQPAEISGVILDSNDGKQWLDYAGRMNLQKELDFIQG